MSRNLETDTVSVLLTDYVEPLKRWIEEWQINNENLSWYDCLNEIVAKYNDHNIKTLNYSPNILREYGEEYKEAQEQASERGENALKVFHRFKVGDHVRIRLKPYEQPRANSSISKSSKAVSKGMERWSNLVYVIDGIEGLSFKLREMTSSKSASRSYRSHELMRVPKTSVDVRDIFAPVASEARKGRRKKMEKLG